jgi:hypothetical protein
MLTTATPANYRSEIKSMPGDAGLKMDDKG